MFMLQCLTGSASARGGAKARASARARARGGAKSRARASARGGARPLLGLCPLIREGRADQRSETTTMNSIEIPGINCASVLSILE